MLSQRKYNEETLFLLQQLQDREITETQFVNRHWLIVKELTLHYVEDTVIASAQNLLANVGLDAVPEIAQLMDVDVSDVTKMLRPDYDLTLTELARLVFVGTGRQVRVEAS